MLDASLLERRARPVPQAMDCDVLIIGGGIVGAGVARDAASRGLKTILVEQADFASGTSSRSSRLLHGGLRYLAQGHVGLVRESSLEKMRLSRIAPHLCQPLPFLFPVWKGSGWSLWPLAVGVKIYDLLCGGRNLGKSTTLRANGLLQILPGLRSDQLAGGTRHYDALTNDARLVIDTLRTAEAIGAAVFNYTHFERTVRQGTKWRSDVRDRLTNTSVRVTSGAVINAAGAWGAGFPQSRLGLRLTKGVHLVVHHSRLSVPEAVILAAGKRILFVIPWGERTILGTTDTDFSGDPARVHAEPADREYVLNIVNTAFPAAHLSNTDVLSTWAGVRPLIAPRTTQAGAPSDISRSHVIRMTEPGWFDVAGGKLTTYRHMAEQTIDAVGISLDMRLPRSLTAEKPLQAGKFSSVLPPDVNAAVVTEACQREWAVHLDDVLIRRTSWHTYHGYQQAMAEQVAGWMAKELGWNQQHVQQELERYRQCVQ